MLDNKSEEMEWKCLICEKPIEMGGYKGSMDPACWPSVVGGTISIDFGYPSKFDQMNGWHGDNEEVQACICDECFEKKQHLTRTVEIHKTTQWRLAK